jgi:hypothetical protein
MMPEADQGSSAIIIQSLQVDLKREKNHVRDREREVSDVLGRNKVQQEQIGSLELQAIEARSENSMLKIRVRELERLCESQSAEIGRFKILLEEVRNGAEHSSTGKKQGRRDHACPIR